MEASSYFLTLSRALSVKFFLTCYTPLVEEKPKIVVVVGPTASGKSALAIEIAKRFKGEVISADSRQVYRDLDIGTAKVTREEMQGVPHHLLDIADVGDTYTATDFKRDAEKAIAGIAASGKLPVIAGGTFFYIDTLLDRVSPAPVPPNPELRARLDQQDATTLFASLEKLDPVRAASIDPFNKRRLIRALEIIATGETASKFEIGSRTCPYDVLMIGIAVDKDELRQRIAARAPEWLQNGFVGEVQRLVDERVSNERIQELGFEYQLGLELLNHELTEEAFVQKFTEKNWQYAKRQLTWLKRDESIEWYNRKDSESVFERVEEFLL